ncbi:MAG: hypothetical protein V9H69_27605 [Anaerolineae bacterium]
MDGLKTLEDEIRHFQHITVLLKPMADALRHEIANVSLFPQRQQREAQLREQFASQQLSFDDLLVETAALNQIRASAAVNALEVRYVANHYYVPVILANDQKIDYIQHIIRAESEVRFVRQLEAYAQSAGNSAGPLRLVAVQQAGRNAGHRLPALLRPRGQPHPRVQARFRLLATAWDRLSRGLRRSQGDQDQRLPAQGGRLQARVRAAVRPAQGLRARRPARPGLAGADHRG